MIAATITLRPETLNAKVIRNETPMIIRAKTTIGLVVQPFTRNNGRCQADHRQPKVNDASIGPWAAAA
jgi:hypothetical protein